MRLLHLLKTARVIPAVRSIEKVECAARSSSPLIYLLCGSLSNLDYLVQILGSSQKKMVVNLDLFGGLARDSQAVQFLAGHGVAGVISTHPDILGEARSNGLFTIQRTFLLDSGAVESSIRSLGRFLPDAVELLPAPAAPRVVGRIRTSYPDVALIAGGLVSNLKEAEDLIASGIDAVSVSDPAMWEFQRDS